MKKNLFSILLAADSAAGNGPASAPGKTEDRALKAGHVKVRATGQPVNLDGTHIPNGKGESAVIHEKHLPRLGGLVTKVATIAAILFLGFAAQAQVYSAAPSVSITNGSTVKFDGSSTTNQTVAALTTNTCNSVITLTKYDQVAIQPVFKLMGSGTTAVAFNFDWSGDSSNWVSYYTASVTPAGTASVTGIWSTNVGPVGYLRLSTIGNPNANAITNLNIKVITKPSRFGS